MVETRKLRAACATLASAMALSGCMIGGPRTPPANVPTVEGAWISADGVAVSTFAGGVFTTTATDTGNKLADGSYTVTDPQNVAVTVISRIRNTTANVNCALTGPDQLNCTSSTGTQFVLNRRVPTA